jgi:hypothetical protein
MGSYYVFLRYAKLWELRRREEISPDGAGGVGRPWSDGN